MDLKLVFLGTGGSTGTPTIGCSCAVCHSPNPKNKRLRSSVLLKVNGKQFLIDASPDIREASLQYNIQNIDGILITHPHEDHIGGMNDVRPFFTKRNSYPIPLLSSEYSYKEIHVRFSYAMDRFLSLLLPQEAGSIDFAGILVRYFSYHQLDMPVTGYRIGNLAYITDIKEYPKTIFSHLQNLDTLIVGTIHESGSAMHFSLTESLDFIHEVRPAKAYLTHISHDIDHEKMSKKLPPKVFLAYDGAEIS